MSLDTPAFTMFRPGRSGHALKALCSFLAPLAGPSSVETFTFTGEWMRTEAGRVTADASAAAITHKFNLPPSYALTRTSAR